MKTLTIDGIQYSRYSDRGREALEQAENEYFTAWIALVVLWILFLTIGIISFGSQATT